MGLETSVNHVSDLNPQFPTETDALMQGDNHIRNIKQALRSTFQNITGPLTPTQGQINKLSDVTVSAAELNTLAGMTENIRQALEALETTAELALDTLVPVGQVISYAGSTVPSVGFWSFCDGGEINRLEHPVLFSRIGTSWGAGNGTTTFNKPDLRGRTIIGAGHGGGLTNRIIGQRAGAEVHQLSEGQMPNHGHFYEAWTQAAGQHNHGYFQAEQYIPVTTSGWATYGWLDNPQNPHHRRTTDDGNHSHYVSGNTHGRGGNEAHNNMQPYGVCNWLIRVK